MLKLDIVDFVKVMIRLADFVKVMIRLAVCEGYKRVTLNSFLGMETWTKFFFFYNFFFNYKSKCWTNILGIHISRNITLKKKKKTFIKSEINTLSLDFGRLSAERLVAMFEKQNKTRAGPISWLLEMTTH